MNCAPPSSCVPKVSWVFCPVATFEREQLVVAAGAREVDDRLAVGRPGRREVAEVVLGDVADFAALEIDDEDVAGGAVEAREGDFLAVRADVGRLRHVDRLELDALVDLAGDRVLQDERLHLLGAGEVGDRSLAGDHDIHGTALLRKPPGVAMYS